MGLVLTSCQRSPEAFIQIASASVEAVAVDGLRAVSISAAVIDEPAVIASSPNILAARTASPGNVAYAICAHVQNWERPSESEHLRQLAAIPRYGKTIYEDPLRSLLADFRGFPVISFATYGLSARSEPLYLSGVWTVLDDIEACYSQGQPARMGEGELGETWLMGYAANGLIWVDGMYQLTVEPAQGLQILQFERQEELATLPMRVVAADGMAIQVHAGDYVGSW
ncbi:hypothetical protein C7271_07680 [filamentous cyanobacterium CCP5]|nr:hypothetical protein C7271_07680 [filamentous cyanobacterium CCP5]